jgi:biopolymer transport protein ExbD
VLLIIFMVITPLTPRGLDALLPQARDEHPSRESTTTIVIQVSQRNAGPVLRINGEPVELDTLSARITQIFAARAEKVVFVTGDADLDFAEVAAVIDIAHASGIDKVGLMTAPLAKPL